VSAKRILLMFGSGIWDSLELIACALISIPLCSGQGSGGVQLVEAASQY
jgi:hypothetical protein